MTKATGNNNSRFTLDMTPELRTRLKIAAAHKGVTMREYCLSAIEQQLARELHQPAVYDTHYLALAEILDCDLLTADERFFNSVKEWQPRVRWLRQYVRSA